jgi:hypothetical protein
MRNEMKVQRILLSSYVLVSMGLLNGHVWAEQPSDASVKSAQQALVAEKPHRHSKDKISQHKTHKHPQMLAAKLANKRDARGSVNDSELQKPLDLSIPYMDVDKSDRLNEQGSEDQDQKANLFASENRKKTRPLQVDGRLLMSPEPEAEKQKSADGAGIVINLKP